MPRAALLLMAVVLAAAGCSTVEPAPARTIAQVLPASTSGWNTPLRFTRGPDADYNADYDAARDVLYYVADRDGNADVFRQPGALTALQPVERLTTHPARDRWPRVNRAGSSVLFVSTREDSGGDVYLLHHRWLLGWKLSRLTGEKTLDDQPSWAPDGRTFFYAASPGLGQPFDVYRAKPGGTPERLTTKGGQMPDCSPDGRYLVYAASRDGSGPHLYVMRLADHAEAALTAGPALDLYPCWSEDGKSVYFVRFALDTNGDGILDRRDASSIFSVRFSADLFNGGTPAPVRPPPVRPLTSMVASDAFPRPLPNGFTFTRMDASGGADVYALGESGEMPVLHKLSEFMAFGRRVDEEEEANVYGRLLAWQNAAWAARSPDEVAADLPDPAGAAVAYLRMGQALLDLDRPQAAADAFAEVEQRFPGARRYVGAARIELLKIERRSPALDVAAHLQKARDLEREFQKLAVAATGDEAAELQKTAALARLEIGESLLVKKDLAGALDAFNAVPRDYPAQAEADAQALLGTARVYAALGGPGSGSSARDAYLHILHDYPAVQPYALRAAELAVDTIVSPDAAFEDKVSGLRALIEKYSAAPILPALAQNYIGDLYYARKDFLKALTEYERTISAFPKEGAQVAAAYLSIGRIRTQQQDYARAVETFRKMEGAFGKAGGWLYRQARQGYVNSMLLRAQHARDLGDTALALNTYASLAAFEPDLAAAHRGLVECYAALGRVDDAIRRYRPRVEADPRDHLADYALALAYSYYGPSDWVGDSSAARRRAAIDTQALRLVGEAILMDSNVAYYHQLRGFMLSRMALTTGDKTYNARSLDAYLAALGLGSRRGDPANWPNLLFNVGEGYMLVEQPSNAFDYYKRAVDAGFSLEGDRGRAAMLHMSRSAMAAGQYAFAADMLKKLLAGLQKADGNASLLQLRAQTLDRLALVHNLDGAYADAVASYRDYVRDLESLSKLEPAKADAYARNLLRAYRNMAVNLYLAEQHGQASAAALTESYQLIRRAVARLDAGRQRAVAEVRRGGAGDHRRRRGPRGEQGRGRLRRGRREAPALHLHGPNRRRRGQLRGRGRPPGEEALALPEAAEEHPAHRPADRGGRRADADRLLPAAGRRSGRRGGRLRARRADRAARGQRGRGGVGRRVARAGGAAAGPRRHAGRGRVDAGDRDPTDGAREGAPGGRRPPGAGRSGVDRQPGGTAGTEARSRRSALRGGTMMTFKTKAIVGFLLLIASAAGGCGPLVGVKATISVDQRTQLEREVLGQRAEAPPEQALLMPSEAAHPDVAGLYDEYTAMEARLAALPRKDATVRAWQVISTHNRGVLKAWLGDKQAAAALLKSARDRAAAYWLGTLQWQCAADLAFVTGDKDGLTAAAEGLLNVPLLTELDYRFESPARRDRLYAALIGDALAAGDAETAFDYALQEDAVELARATAPGAIAVPAGRLHDAVAALDAARRDLAARREARCAQTLDSLNSSDGERSDAFDSARQTLATLSAAGGLFVPAPEDAVAVRELLPPGVALLAYEPAGDGYAGFLLSADAFEAR